MAQEIHVRPVEQIIEDILEGINNEQPGLLLELSHSARRQVSALGMAPDAWSEEEEAASEWEYVRDSLWGAMCAYLDLAPVLMPTRCLAECPNCGSALRDDHDESPRSVVGSPPPGQAEHSTDVEAS